MPIHLNATLDDVSARLARVIVCPDCGQMEIWTNEECSDHGVCRAGAVSVCEVCGQAARDLTDADRVALTDAGWRFAP